MATRMRAKFFIRSVERLSDTCEILNMNAVAAKSYGSDGMDEDNTYAKFSPSADLKLTVCNPALIGKFNPGEKFYVDFSPVEEQKAAAA